MSDSCEPPRSRVRLEPNIPPGFSSLPAVQEMIDANNRQTRPKLRLKQLDFINDVFTRLGERAVNDAAVVAVLSSFLQECVERHGTLPRSSALAKVLYQWTEKGLVAEGQRLLKQVLLADSSLRRNVIDEKVATVSLRLLGRSASVDVDLMNSILSMLPEGAHKRRLFFPLLEHAARTGDTALAFNTLRMGESKRIEFWDVDYSQLLRSIQNAATESSSTAALLDELLESMVEHHPVVGKSNGEALQHLMAGEMADVDDKTGECSRCGTKLKTFDFSPADRATLLNDIETKLIAPRVGGENHYEPERVVTPIEKERRWREFEVFKQTLTSCDYDAVIDGANVGYYGLSSWYREAKEACLRARGVDPTTVPEHQLCEVPLPVDVPPKFSLINEMLTQTRRIGKKPLVMLHKRHVESPSKENAEWLLKWKNDSSLIACPAFINDDYCWLYAAIRKPDCLFISNDQMRDHHFMLLSRRSFLRWRQRHRVTYRVLFQRATGSTALLLALPRPFSVWVQRGLLSRTHWHVPVLLSADIIDQATNKASGKDVEVGKDGDDSCDVWLCTAAKHLLNRSD
ncbi:uncharacterized protein Tco025E_04271 [Trypanosoma conorhini]|uniref:PRORP domain-containing protein n=1 Tax=Trypanosoma conorhini TaxID=83891 RepID=A0A422PML0_9TRYP|nr:uncharacterized protein Tco025E_04271 [Trypanosoma conorhini]RNF18942.1 hypothetical protein Tco025E_04271 [Trypanosoma conorhini]